MRTESNHTQYLRKRKYSMTIQIQKFFLLLPQVKPIEMIFRDHL